MRVDVSVLLACTLVDYCMYSVWLVLSEKISAGSVASGQGVDYGRGGKQPASFPPAFWCAGELSSLCYPCCAVAGSAQRPVIPPTPCAALAADSDEDIVSPYASTSTRGRRSTFSFPDAAVGTPPPSLKATVSPRGVDVTVEAADGTSTEASTPVETAAAVTVAPVKLVSPVAAPVEVLPIVGADAEQPQLGAFSEIEQKKDE